MYKLIQYFVLKSLFVGLLFVGPYVVWGQESPSYVPTVVPPSPDAAALGTYGNIDVGLQTGKPNINVPLHTIQVGDIQVPIQLNYLADGFKIGEIPGIVGHHWSLQAGGAVSRTVVCKPDEYSYFSSSNKFEEYLTEDKLQEAATVTDPTNNELAAIKTFFKQVIRGSVDVEPDIFTYNFPSSSGSFVFDFNMNLVQVPFNNLDISVINGDQLAGFMQSGFEIVDPQGITYRFTAREATNVRQLGVTDSPEPWDDYTSSWYLTKITDTKGNTVEFVYSGFQSAGRIAQSISQGQSEMLSLTYQDNHCKNKTIYPESKTEVSHWITLLQEIRYRGGKVKFSYSSERRDFPASTQLDRVEVFTTGKATAHKTFDLSYGYFESNTDNSVAYLKLESVKETGENGVAKPPYRFEYNETKSFPSVDSKAQDFWGYCNGIGNPTLMPEFEIYIMTRDGRANFKTFEGGNRSVDVSYARLGTLEKMYYPTGGHTSFEYEGNESFTGEREKIYREVQTLSATLAANGCDYTDPESELTYDIYNLIVSYYGDVSAIPNYTTSTFTIPEDKRVAATVELSSFFIQGTNMAQLRAELHRNGELEYTFGPSGTPPNYFKSHRVLLSGGDYVLKVWSGGECSVVNCKVSWEEETNKFVNTKVGGLRIKRITDHDGRSIANDQVRFYDFTLHTLDNERSSGRLSSMGEPRYYYKHDEEYLVPTNDIIDQGPFGGSECLTCVYYVRTSNSVVPQSATMGGHLNYTQVTEYFGADGENGKREVVFTHYPDRLLLIGSSVLGNHHQGRKSSPRPWKRGLLERETLYAYEAEDYRKLKETNHTYRFIEINEDDQTFPHEEYNWLHGKAIGMTASIGSHSNCDDSRTIYQYGLYDIESAWYHLEKTVTTTFDPTGQETLTTKEEQTFFYDNTQHVLPTRTHTLTSEGDQYIQRTSYAMDYTGSLAQTLVEEHRLATPIEQVTTKIPVGLSEEHLVASTLTEYKEEAGKILPKKVYQTNTQPGTAFEAFQTAQGNVDALTKDPTYHEKIHFKDYGDYGNPLHYQTYNQPNVRYQWGYDDQYPVVQIADAGDAPFYYNSFEEGGTADTKAKTGNKVRNSGTFTIPITLPTGQTYVLSYWYWAAGKWQLHTEEVTAATLAPISQGSKLDEVRLYPKGAQMSTFTYLPGIGKQTETGPDNRTVYYVYDGLHRLKWLKDEEGNILKTYQYYYYED